jgi:hypothetical protein
VLYVCSYIKHVVVAGAYGIFRFSTFHVGLEYLMPAKIIQAYPWAVEKGKDCGIDSCYSKRLMVFWIQEWDGNLNKVEAYCVREHVFGKEEVMICYLDDGVNHVVSKKYFDSICYSCCTDADFRV